MDMEVFLFVSFNPQSALLYTKFNVTCIFVVRCLGFHTGSGLCLLNWTCICGSPDQITDSVLSFSWTIQTNPFI